MFPNFLKPLLVSDHKHLSANEFDLFTKCVMVEQHLPYETSFIPLEFHEVNGELNLQQVKPWWLVNTEPSMLVLTSSSESKSQNLVICTYSNWVGKDKHLFRRSVFDGGLDDLNIENIISHHYPNLENKQNWFRAINSHAKNLDGTLWVIKNKKFSIREGEFVIKTSDGAIGAELLASLQTRSRIKALLIYGLKLQEHSELPQITNIWELDAYINFLAYKRSSPTPNMSSEILRVFDYYNYIYSIQQNDLLKAVDLYKDLLSKVPDFVAPRINCAIALMKIERFDDAYRELDIAFNYAPEDPDLFTSIGNLMNLVKDSSAEISAYTTALNLDPNHYTASDNLGLVFVEQKNYSAAEYWLLRTLQSLDVDDRYSPELKRERYIATSYSLVNLYLDTNKISGALVHLKKCIELDPQNQEFEQMKLYLNSRKNLGNPL